MATHKEHEDHLSAADRAEQERTANADAQRRSHTQSAKLRPVDTFEALEKHQKEVEEDEKARTEAFENSARGKRIKASQEKTGKAAEGKGKSAEPTTEEEAKKASREAMPPGYSKEGTVELPQGASLPPSVPEPRWPNAPAWAPPLADPPAEEDAEAQPVGARNR